MADALVEMRALLWGFRQSCVAFAAVHVGLIQRLATAPAGEEELARELALDPGALRRFLRALLALDVVAQQGGRIALTDRGRALHELKDFAQLIGEEYLPAWGQLSHSLRSGETAFEHLFGTNVWKHREANPHLNDAINRTMVTYQQSQLGAVVEAYDFSETRKLVDVGGNFGALACAILSRYPAIEAVLFDLPQVVPGMRAHLEENGMTARCRAVGGSFFEEVPAGGDTYLLKHILHNWDDTRSVEILRSCRRAMAAGGRLLIIENIMGDPSEGWTTDGHWNDFALDLHMMSVLGGQVRRLDQFDALFAAAGFTRRRTFPGPLLDIIEAEPIE